MNEQNHAHSAAAAATAHRPVVVIGSGFGGAVVAARLAEAGIPTCLIERGPWRDSVPVRSMGIDERAPFPQGRQAWRYLLRSLRHAWLPGGEVTCNRRGLFELHLGRDLHIISSSGVGGGSHVYSGLNVRPPDPAYWDGIAEGLSAAAMEAHYATVLERLGSRAPLADDGLPNTLEERFRDNPALAVRGTDYALTMGFQFPEVPGQPRRVTTADGVERDETRPGEDGNLGSIGGGKTTLDFAYLARARRHGLAIRDLCEVTSIARHAPGADGGSFTVAVRDLRSGEKSTIAAAQVVLAAGTMNTLKLLFASRAAGGLTGMAPLGRRFGGNGDYFGYWNLNDRSRDLSVGMPAHGTLQLAQAEALGAGVAWPLIAEGSLPSPRALPFGRWVGSKLAHGTYVAGMGEDAQDGTVEYRRGRLRIEYRVENSPIYARIKQAFKLLGTASARRIYHFERPITVHPTGGACIGRMAADGVVSATGEVFDNPGLYVADAAALPKPVGGPPSLTIAAWAEHVAAGLIASRAAHA